MARLSVAPETRVTISAKWKLLMKTRPIGRRTPETTEATLREHSEIGEPNQR